jgi:ABC-2 type transport system permease protein
MAPHRCTQGLRNVWHLGLKELRSLLHDRAMLVLIAFAFTLAIYSAATGTPQTLQRAPLAVVDEDHSTLSMRLREAFGPPYFLAPPDIALREVDPAMDAGRYTFVLDVPQHFERDLLGGRAPTLQLSVDATRMTQAFTGGAYVQAICQTEIAEFLQRHRSPDSQAGAAARLVLRNRFNPALTPSWFGAVAELINNVTMLGIVLTGAAWLREREHGSLEHLLAMPLSPLEIMAAKVWSMGLVVLLGCCASLWLVVHGLIGLPLPSTTWVFVLGAALQMFAVTSLGIFLATLARSMPQMGLLLIMVLLPLEMLSGASTPRESMPEAVRLLMLAAPTTHFVSLSQATLFRAAGLAEVWPQLLAIAGIGASFFGIALARLRSTMGAMS